MWAALLSVDVSTLDVWTQHLNDCAVQSFILFISHTNPAFLAKVKVPPDLHLFLLLFPKLLSCVGPDSLNNFITFLHVVIEQNARSGQFLISWYLRSFVDSLGEISS